MKKRCQRGTHPGRMLNRGLCSSSFDFISSHPQISLFSYFHIFQIYRFLRDSKVQDGRINSRKGGREKSLEKNMCESKSMDNHIDSGRNEIERWRKKGLGQCKLYAHGFPDGGDGVGGGVGGGGEDEKEE